MSGITLFQQPVERFPDEDYMNGSIEMEAWRFITPCDKTCQHPVHDFNVVRGQKHIEWFRAGTAPVKESTDD